MLEVEVVGKEQDRLQEVAEQSKGQIGADTDGYLIITICKYFRP